MIRPFASSHGPLGRGKLIFALVNAAVGLLLWLWPAMFAASADRGAVPWWAWSLTPLTARVVGGWYLAAAALCATLSQRHPFEAVRVALLGVMFATGLEWIGAGFHAKAFDGPALMIGLYLLNACAVFGFALFSWFRIAGAAPSPAT